MEFASNALPPDASLSRNPPELSWEATFLEALVDSSLDGVVMVNDQGETILQNQRLLELFEIPQGLIGENLAKDPIEWIPASTQNSEEFVRKVAYLHAHPAESSRDEIFLKSGAVLDRSSFPVIDRGGRFYGRVWNFRDITWRKRAQEELLRSQTSLQIAARLARIGAWSVMLPISEVTWSDEVCTIHEVPRGFAPNLEQAISYHAPEFRELISQTFAECIDAGTSFDVESQIITAIGRRVWVRSIGEPVRNPEGEIIGVQGALQDISEQSAAKNQLASNEALLRQFIQHTPAAIAMLDMEMCYVQTSERWINDYHLTGQEIVGKSHYEIFPDVSQAWKDIHQRVLAGAIEKCDEDPFPRADGSTEWLQWEARPWRNATGEIGGLIFFTQVITARKQAEEELFRSRETLRGILDHIPQRVFWKNHDLVFEGCNNAFASDMGYSGPGEVIGKTDYETPWKALAENYRAVDRRVIDLDLPEISFEEPIIDLNGKEGWLRTSKIPLHDQQGRVTGVLGTYEDVTAANLAKMEIKRLDAQLFESQKMETVGKLAGGIAHEFNSIMTAIIGRSELLLGQLAPENALTKNVIEIRIAADRAATLTRQLLAYGRKQILAPVSLNLNSIVGGMESTLRHLLGRGAEVQITLAADLRPVRADAAQLEQVIINLAMNAADAMPNGGKLTLETSNLTLQEDASTDLPSGDYVLLIITDTGTGMTEEIKARIFEPFFSTKAVGQGTGLGLSTCQGIIKQSGGHISVRSEPGGGSAFTIYLPRVEVKIAAPVERLNRPDLPSGTETILLVEDDAALREMAAILLRRLGYNVLAAGDGIEALSLQQRHANGPIDLLFTDVTLPKMSGRDLADRLEALYPQIQILFTSAYSESANIHHGLTNKGVALLQKPFTPSALARQLREMLDQTNLPQPISAQ